MSQKRTLDRLAGKARSVIAAVRDAVREWPRFAAEAEVREEFAEAIGVQLAKEVK